MPPRMVTPRTVPVAVCLLSLLTAAGRAQTMSPPLTRWQRLSPAVLGQLITRPDGRIQRLVLMRGTPGWFLGNAVTVPGAPGRSTGPGLSTEIRERQIVLQGIPHDLGPGNLVFVDDMDFTGTRARVSVTTADFEGLNRNAPWLEIVRRSREAISFLRCGESIPSRQWGDAPAAINDSLTAATTKQLNAVVCDDLAREGAK